MQNRSSYQDLEELSLSARVAGVHAFPRAVAGSTAFFPLEDSYKLQPDPATAEANGSSAIDFKDQKQALSSQILYSLFQILNKNALGSNLDASKLAQFAMKFKDAQQCDVY